MQFVDLKAQHALIGDRVNARIQEVLESGRYVLGPLVEELEDKLADFADVRHAISVSSGTDALFVALLARGIGAGDAVFIPGFTFTATAEVIVLAGATPVFVDVERDSYNISPDDLDRRIAEVEAEGKFRPAAVIAVDLFGAPADYKCLREITDRYGMFLVADAAQSFGAVRDNRRVGGLAAVTTTSFYPSKPLGCYGDGGAVFTDDDELAAVLKSVRCHGEGNGAYDNVRIGINGRLDAIQAAVLLTKLEIFQDELESRERIARSYDSALDGVVEIPSLAAGIQSSWAQYTIRTPERDRLRSALSDAGIPTMVYYPKPIHMQPAYQAYGDGPGSLPVSERLCEEVISLPFHPYLEDHEIETVAGAVRDTLGA
ncbi:MAG: DegT/DnrJ/EryC1/StrS aminotransferase family protein [Rhizobiales bacterium]|nr:DegT/DnrJ/EryC1/StrS aminotransferase family protein [Hyphomicrobiales bacterium]